MIQLNDRTEYWLGLKVENNEIGDANRLSWNDKSTVGFTNFNIFKSAMGVNYD